MKEVKSLSLVQRRMLADLYGRKMDNVIAQESAKLRSQAALDQLLEETVKDNDELKKAVKEYRKHQEGLKELGKKLTDSRISISGGYYSDKIYLAHDHPAKVAYDEKTRDTIAKLNEAKDRILAEIWGIDASYEEVVKRIEKLVKEALA